MRSSLNETGQLARLVRQYGFPGARPYSQIRRPSVLGGSAGRRGAEGARLNGADLITGAPNRWCPGCGNFIIQHAFKDVLVQMAQEGFPIENVVIVTGIGQHGKMFDYMNVNAFYSIHGRTIPVATGITLSNPDLKVICFAGDGDAYAEGLDHTIFGAKRNVDITVFVHDNRVYGLTTGQYTPTSPAGFRGRSTPAGSVEMPLNPLELMLTSGATFVARAYTQEKGAAQGAHASGDRAPWILLCRYPPDLFELLQHDRVLRCARV